MASSLRICLAALVLCASPSLAQSDGGLETPGTPSDVESLRRELEATRKDLKEMREEVRAQLATQSVAQGWSEDYVDEKRKLEVFVPDGYFRVRPELLHRLDLGRNPDPAGYTTFPIPPTSTTGSVKERTLAGVNMRFRFEPTFNISEEVRIRMQVDALDNVLMGSSPAYAFSRDPSHAYDRDSFSILSSSQNAPTSGINALTSSIAVKRIYGEVSTPVGLLRFGRMGSNWGLGMTHNDGSCLDCNLGDTVDRVMFVAEPLAGYYVTPMFDLNAEGPSISTNSGQPIDASNSDDAHSIVLALARRDTESQVKARLEAGQSVFNYGAHVTYRWQRNDPADYYGSAFTNASVTDGTLLPANTNTGYVQRLAQVWMPDIWMKFERSNLRLEFEGSAVLGNIANVATNGADAVAAGKNQAIGLIQFGAVLQGEYRLMDGALQIIAEVGFASGDKAPGFGNYPRRKVAAADNITVPGDIDGPQYACPSTGGCGDSQIRNFRFNRDYKIDMILFNEILGGITDALYIKPTVRYRIADGFHATASVIYSRAIYAESTPSAALQSDGTIKGDANLGFEINAGVRYETEDGFFGELRWGILFPLGGFGDPRTTAAVSLDSAQALRGAVGIHF